MSKEEIAEVIGMLTEVLENVDLEINELKTETKGRFESIKNHMKNLVKDHEDFKEWNTKSNVKNEKRLVEKENNELKKKFLELESSLKEKEQVMNSLIESFTYQQQPPQLTEIDGTQRKEKQRHHKIQSKIISLVPIVLVLSA